jgi:hypothetical protein
LAVSDEICAAEVRECADGLQEIGELIAPRFARSEPRENAVAYVRGLISDEERKNSWTLSERAGYGTPDPMQRLLPTTDWDTDALRDDLRSYVETAASRTGAWPTTMLGGCCAQPPWTSNDS